MIKLIVVGKIKEKYLKEAIKEYEKRLSKYTKLETIQLDDSNPKAEKELILKNIGTRDFVVTLEINGQVIDSKDMSEKLDNWLMNNAHVCFIIGGSDGLDDDVKKRSNYALSFSKMTFPHQLFRVILLEQIYRSFKIIKNESYHK